MAMKKRSDISFVSFDVLYEDGSRSSNRRVPAIALEADEDASAKAAIEAQDRAISHQSGRQRPSIKSVARSAR